MLHLLCQANAHKLPAGMWWKEIAIGGANVRERCCARAATQDELIAHKFPIVFSYSSCSRLITGIGSVGTLRPFPYVSIHLSKLPTGRGTERCGVIETLLDEVSFHWHVVGCCFPLGFGREACIGPAGISVGFVVADM